MDKSTPDGKPDDAERQRYSREFKIEAVRQLEEGKVSGVQLALMLGVKKELATHGPDVSFPGTGKVRTDERAEIRRLKRELAQVTEERDILKKAAAYFARELP